MPNDRSNAALTRRELLRRSGMGFGALALAQLVGGEGLLREAVAAQSLNPLGVSGRPRFRPRPSE